MILQQPPEYWVAVRAYNAAREQAKKLAAKIERMERALEDEIIDAATQDQLIALEDQLADLRRQAAAHQAEANRLRVVPKPGQV